MADSPDENLGPGKPTNFVMPTRQILSEPHMSRWKCSEAFMDYKGFLTTLNEAVKGKSISSAPPPSDSIQTVLNILNSLDEWITLFPPIQQAQRFGNAAFRQWHGKLKEDSCKLLEKEIPEKYSAALVECLPYFLDSFGNPQRIDYGTGHELSFIWFMLVLYKISFFNAEDMPNLVLKIFNRYLQLARKLQTTYRMEPAGSRGVWSLDDFQFIPFYWGSSQLTGHETIEPKSFLNQELLERHKDDYLFLSCIDYINTVKSGPFFEHSNQLYHISGVPSWDRVNKGLLRMYEDQVLLKFPVVQHLLFGSQMSIERAKPQQHPMRPPSKPFDIDAARPP